MSDAIIYYYTGPNFRFAFWGLVVFTAGIFVAVEQLPLGLLVFAAGIYITLSPAGVEFHARSAHIRPYQLFLGMHFGFWKPYDPAKGVAVGLHTGKSQLRYLGVVVAPPRSNIVFMRGTNGEIMEIREFKSLDKAVSFGTKLAAELQVSFTNEVAQLFDRSAENRAKRDPRSIRRFRFRK